MILEQISIYIINTYSSRLLLHLVIRISIIYVPVNEFAR